MDGCRSAEVEQVAAIAAAAAAKAEGRVTREVLVARAVEKEGRGAEVGGAVASAAEEGAAGVVGEEAAEAGVVAEPEVVMASGAAAF